MVSTRGAHGGYVLARPAEEITMDQAVLALEGAIAPMDCFLDDHDGRVQCSHGEDSGTCATKLLWTRVQMGVIRSLQRTTLAELVEFDARRRADAPAITVTTLTTKEQWPSSRSRTCTSPLRTSRSSRGSTCTSAPVSSTR